VSGLLESGDRGKRQGDLFGQKLFMGAMAWRARTSLTNGRTTCPGSRRTRSPSDRGRVSATTTRTCSRLGSTTSTTVGQRYRVLAVLRIAVAMSPDDAVPELARGPGMPGFGRSGALRATPALRTALPRPRPAPMPTDRMVRRSGPAGTSDPTWTEGGREFYPRRK